MEERFVPEQMASMKVRVDQIAMDHQFFTSVVPSWYKSPSEVGAWR
ncbi:hypothetical protein [Priestia koreensis]|nr:hypothetical protein [Priestia koreensis]